MSDGFDNPFQEFEQQLGETKIAFSGTLESYNPDAPKGARYVLRQSKDTIATGEFVTPPPPLNAKIVAYRWKDGNWLFEEIKKAETRARLKDLPESLRSPSAIALRLQKALAKARTNNLVAKPQGPVKRGTRGVFDLPTPYRGKASLNAFAATRNESSDSILLLAGGGQWVAFSGQAEGTTQKRRDIERGGVRKKGQVNGRVGYLCVVQVRKKPQANSTPSQSSYWWQLWAGGWTENMIRVKEWQAPGVAQTTGEFWRTMEPPTVVFDFREEFFYVSLRYKLDSGERYALLKGRTDVLVNSNGVPTPAIEIVWEKTTSELLSGLPYFGFVGQMRIIGHGFGYWTGLVTSTGDRQDFGNAFFGYGFLNENPNQIGGCYEIYDGAAKAFPQTVGSRSGGSSASAEVPTPVGWRSPPKSATYAFTFAAGTFPAFEQYEAHTKPELYRIAEDGQSAIVSQVNRVRQISNTGATWTDETKVTASFNDLPVYVEKRLVLSAGNTIDVITRTYLFPENIHLPHVVRNAKGTERTIERTAVADFSTGQSVNIVGTSATIKVTVTGNPVQVTYDGSVTNGGGIRIIPVQGDYDLAFGFGVEIFEANPTLSAQDPNYARTDYDFGRDAQHSPYYSDVYRDFVSVISPYSLVNRDRVYVRLFNPIFSGQNSIETENRDCLVTLLTPELTSSYAQGTLEVEVFRTKQISDMVDAQASGTALIEVVDYAFSNASFAADGY